MTRLSEVIKYLSGKSQKLELDSRIIRKRLIFFYLCPFKDLREWSKLNLITFFISQILFKLVTLIIMVEFISLRHSWTIIWFVRVLFCLYHLSVSSNILARYITLVPKISAALKTIITNKFQVPGKSLFRFDTVSTFTSPHQIIASNLYFT